MSTSLITRVFEFVSCARTGYAVFKSGASWAFNIKTKRFSFKTEQKAREAAQRQWHVDTDPSADALQAFMDGPFSGLRSRLLLRLAFPTA